MLVNVLATLPQPGDESVCAAYGLNVPDADVVRHFRDRQDAEWRRSGGADAGVPNPYTLPMCMVPQLLGADLDPNGSCDASPKAGWCVFAGTCEEQLGFSSKASPTGDLAGARITVACSQGC